MSWKKQLPIYSLTGQIEADDLTYVSNARHIALLNQALQAIKDAIRMH